MNGVPQEKYDENYYTHNCEGFTESGMPGTRLQALLSHFFRLNGEEIARKKVFDMGCGRGEVARFLSVKGCQVLSADYSLAACKRFHEVNMAELPFIRHDLSKGMPWIQNDYFDLVVLADVVEHVYKDQLEVIGQDAVRVAKHGGLILIDTPIMNGGESELHVDIKASAQEVHNFFKGTELLGTHWHKKPEHCNIILRKI